MAENSKRKLLCILEIMKKTDENHPLNATQIAQKLEAYGITAERKSISRDLQCLEEAGYSIVKCEDHNRGCYMTDQLFEDYELKLLADSVGAAKYLTTRDSRALIGKIKQLATMEGEALIDRTTYLDDDLKSDDGKNKVKLDLIIRAILNNRQISFQYHQHGNVQSDLIRNGYRYHASPYFLALHDEQYYLVVNLSTHNHATHFKLEGLTRVQMENDPIRPMNEIEEFKGPKGHTFNVTEYLKRSMNMWNGEAVTVTLRCENWIKGDILKKFGKSVPIMNEDEEHFRTIITVADKDGFYQWCASYGTNIRIESPDNVRETYLTYVNNILKMYNEN